ncbi:type II secretion system secretin GspD [Ideonella sp. BN130291]|uniref:type II secretion system secretin GspD n=1 Tax=Ideonella sp. BN130291 TaxID=3112940 RepID=UPI002E26EED5|nr:type II secretion system secretin GspD [Ideonella sp. BN130291]
MNERLLSTPARRRRAERAKAFTCTALATSVLLASLPLQAQTEDDTAPRQSATGRAAANRSRTPVTLNFVNADIEAVSRAMGAMLDRPIIVDPRVRGTITVYSEQPLSVREAYLNYLAALRGLGFTVVENTGLLKVVPEADAKLQAGTVSVGAPVLRGDQIVTQVFRLNHENANNLVTVLRPLISPNNTINANPGNNTLVVTDYADNLQRISRIIAAMDTPASTDVEVVPLQHAVAADLAPLVQRLAEGGSTGGFVGAPGVPGIATPGGSSVIADTRSNSLIVRAGNQAKLSVIRNLIEKLDRPMGSAGPAGNIYVVYLRNADAAKLATVLRAAFAGGSGGSGSGGSSALGGGGSSGGFGGQNPSANVTSLGSNSAGGTASTAATAPLAASASPSTGGFVQADPATNSLIITAPEPLYRQVRAVIDQLDSRRAQVYVEALIVEVDADRAAELGLQWQGISGNKGDTNIIGLGTNFGSGVTSILGASKLLAQGITGLATADETALQGINFGVAHQIGSRYTLGVLARALESNTGANILSTPNLVTLDNEEAKIVVGQNVPFVTGSFTNTGTGSGATNPFQTVERKDVGLTLRIRPQIGEGNTVRMTIFQESSAVVAPAAGTQNAGPSTSKRSIESTVVVDDGEILVLGGLIEDNYTDTKSKVPLLGDIPLVGGLFRSENRSRRKTNLMVFLRPVVMRTQEASTKLSMDRYDLIRNLQTDTQPEPRVLVPVNQAPILPAQPNAAPGKPMTGSTGLPTKEPAPVRTAPTTPAVPSGTPN